MALSTIEAEYVATSEACKEMIWLQSLLNELGKEQKNVKILCDSQSAIQLAKNSAFYVRTKHVDIKYHFIRSLLEEDIFSLKKIHTSQNLTDMLTKEVIVEKLKTYLVSSLGLQS